MDAERRCEINRENAKKSTGPRTAEGKAKSARNATKHGILSKRLLLPNEDPAELIQLRRGFRASFRPNDEAEDELVDRMVSATVRRHRAEGVESGLWDWRGLVTAGKLPLPEVFYMDSQNDQSIQKLTRYMTACDREFYRALQALRALQEDRRARGSEEEDWEDEPEDPDDGGANSTAGLNSCPVEDQAEADAPVDGTGSVPGEISPGEPEEEVGTPETPEGCMDPQPPPSLGEVGSTEDGGAASTRWEQLSPREQTLFVVRNSRQVLSVDNLLHEAVVNPYRLERLGPRQLLCQFESLNRVLWRTVGGIGEILKEDGTSGNGGMSGGAGH